MGGVFDGVRVLELAGGLAGPYACMFLADHGADVVKAEPPSGDPYRADPGFHTVNRAKRSVVTGDVAALARVADVIVTDEPGRAASLRATNPGAVIVSMPPWGQRGPKVHDPHSPDLLAAATGIMWNQYSYAEVPVQVVVPLVGYATGLLGAVAIAAGLVARARFGSAPTYEVSQVAGAGALQLAEFYEGDTPPERPGSCPMGSKGRVACYRLFEASDGKWLFLACGTTRFYERMLEVIGRPDLLGHPELPAPPWGLALPEAIAYAVPILEEAFSRRTRDEWVRVLRAADVPCAPVLTRDEYLATSMVAANHMDVTVQHPDAGAVRMMGVPVVLEAAPGAVRGPAPRLGEHTAAAVAEWAACPPVPAPLTEECPPPLAGMRAVDLASFIAGPLVTRHLAALGADVVKVEPPGGDPFRAFGPPFTAWNQGKRSIVVDLHSADGQAVLRGLAARADVVVENFRPGTAARLGADDATLRALRPDLVTLSSPGYGDDASMAPVPAFDPLLQALGGIMAAQGGDDEPVFLTVPVHDVCTPMISAFGVLAALYHRERTGQGQRVRTSLAQATMAVQAAEYTRVPGRVPAATGGFDHAGPGPARTWVERDGEPWWVEGDASVRVSTRGLLAEEIATANDLVVHQDHPEFGRIALYGQLIGGAGPSPGRGPVLDEHGDEVRRELGL